MIPKPDPSLTEEQIAKNNAELDERLRRERDEHFCKVTGVPQQHWSRTGLDWSGAWGQRTKKLIERSRSDPRMMVALISRRNGSGKTQCAVEIIRDASKRGVPSVYVRAMELFMALKFSSAESFDSPKLAKFSRVGLLVIDEVQINTASWAKAGEEFAQDMLTTLIDSRYGAGKSTVIIGNCDAEGLLNLIGSNAHSRLTECGGISIFESDNFREKKGK